MTEPHEKMCPLFPDTPCPRAEEGAADECLLRLETDYDPMTQANDFLFLHCALHRAQQAGDKTGNSGSITD